MSKIRVYELAKELDVENKTLLAVLDLLKVDVKNHMSSLTDEQHDLIVKHYQNNSGQPIIRHKDDKKKETKAKTVVKEKAVSEKPVQKTETTQAKPERPARESQAKRTSSNTDHRNNNTNKNSGDRSSNTNRNSNNERSNNTNRNSNNERSNNTNRNSNNERSNNTNRTSNTERSGNTNRNNNNERSNSTNRNSNNDRSGNTSSSTNNDRSSNNNRNNSNDRAANNNRTQNNDRNQANQKSNNDGNSNNRSNSGSNNNRNNSNQNNSNQSNSNQSNSNQNNNNKNSNNSNGNKPGNNGKRGTHNNNNQNKQNNQPSNHKKSKKKRKQVEEVVEVKDYIEIPEQVIVSVLAEKLDVQVSDIIKKLFMRGIMATANEEINYDLAEELAMEYDVLVEKETEKDIVEEYFKVEEENPEDMVKRSPVVVVMGHVDHGKTSLLDALRETNVTAKEHGGITQHIGASVIQVGSGERITFLDTPGHEAFTAMRLRGAMATDIAILVVAADDGVMPQTVEAINHAKAAGVQIIVAVNKIDKPGANPDRVLQELMEYELVAEQWGGDTICVQVSALEKTNLDELLEMISLVAEVEDYKANPKGKARGSIIEAQLDKGRGPVATVLVQNGTIHVGDAIIAGPAYGRIRAMVDDKGRRVKSAGPSTPVEILGLSEVPIAGDGFFVAKNEKEARHIAEKVMSNNREKMIQNTPTKVTLDDLFHQIQVGEMKELNIIVKADTQGSVEAVKQSLLKLSNEEVVIRILHGGVGAVTETDVMLASASNAIIIGFNVRPETSARSIAEREAIDLRLYRVIYNAIEDIQSAMKGMLDPIFEEKIVGHIEIRQTFKVSNVGTIGGGYVLDGKVLRNSLVRLLRDNVVVYEGELASLKRFKDDVKEVATGYECGVMLEKFNDLKEGDIVEAFIMEEIPR